MIRFAFPPSWLKPLMVLLVSSAWLISGATAGAQEPTAAPTSATTSAPNSTVTVDTQTDGNDGQGTGTETPQSNLSGNAKGWLVAGLLVLALVTVAMHYYFLGKSRQEYFRAAASLFQQGVFPQPTIIPAQGDSPRGLLSTRSFVENDGQTTSILEVVGPPSLLRGQQGIYVALLNGARAEQAVWSIDPADMSTATPATGGITVVSPAGEGQFTLTATIPDQGLTTPPQTITILPEAKPAPIESTAPTLPFIGQGFASLVGAVVLIAAVVVLAAIQVSDWEVIGTIFGALAGYLFGTATNKSE